MDKPDATNFLYGFATEHFNAACLLYTGTAGQLRYGKVVRDDQPPNGTYWARVTSQVVDEDQETLRMDQRRFRTMGLVFVQLFCPADDPDVTVRIDRISEYVRNAFRLHQSEIEFTNAVINDNVAAEPNWLRANVSSTYTYRQFL